MSAGPEARPGGPDGVERVVLEGPDGDRLLVPRLGPRDGRRRLVGIAGAPGSGKSTLSAALLRRLGPRAAGVPLDGFHLADVELVRLGLAHRKGAPETFDAWGYAALLDRLRRRPGHTVYAPGFERDLEQPLAGAIPVGQEVEVVLTEGNYLLLDRPEWAAARAALDEVWFVEAEPGRRAERLRARHVAFGKSAEEAAAWVAAVDEPNAALVAPSRALAHLVVDLTGWTPSAAPLSR